jgi:hypothetical protein
MLLLSTKNARNIIIISSSSSSISIITAAVLAKHPTTSTCDADHVATTKPKHQKTHNTKHNQKKKRKKREKKGGKTPVIHQTRNRGNNNRTIKI